MSPHEIVVGLDDSRLTGATLRWASYHWRPAPHSKQLRQRRLQGRIMGAWRSRSGETRRRAQCPLP